jgi:predicted regulator of Ras-like GTPase activity (Roadblock/LC7/MglB family)
MLKEELNVLENQSTNEAPSRDFILTTKNLKLATSLLEDTLIGAGVRTALLIDSAGNIIVDVSKDGYTEVVDALSLAALTAASLAATTQIAQIIGEDDFSLLFHKGQNTNIHFSRVGDNLILISIFGSDVSLGLIRCRVEELSGAFNKLFVG